MIYALHSPREAYRRVEFDARVCGADSAGLVLICFDRFDLALAAALSGDRAGDNQRRSAGLTGALAAITALQLGVDRGAGAAGSLMQFYDAARRTLLGNVLAFDPQAITALREDFAEVGSALATAG